MKEKRGEGGKLKGRIQWEGRKSETREYGLEECKTKGLKQFQISSGVAKKKKKEIWKGIVHCNKQTRKNHLKQSQVQKKTKT